MQESLQTKNISWVNIEEPSNDELAAFVREINLLPVDAEFIVRDHQRPEIAVRADYIIMLVHVPVFEKTLRVTSGAAVYFLITSEKLYTLQYEPVVSLQKIIKDFSDNPEKQEEYFGDSALSLALYVLSELNVSSFRKIRRLAKHIEIAEDAVFQGNERKMVTEIAILMRDVLDFRKIIRPQVSLFSTMPQKPFSDDIKAQWLRIAGQINQLWEHLESLHESSKELRNTNDSLLQYKENELLRLLTFYSIIGIPALILINPYNREFPLFPSIHFFVYWGILMVLAILLVLIFFRFKRRRIL